MSGVKFQVQSVNVDLIGRPEDVFIEEFDNLEDAVDWVHWVLNNEDGDGCFVFESLEDIQLVEVKKLDLHDLMRKREEEE